MSLAILATEENWQGFDEAWTKLMAQGGELEELFAALEVVATKRRMARCMPHVRDHAEVLATAERPGDAALLLGAALRGGGPPNEIVEPLMQYAEKAWSEEPWWNAYCEVAGLHRGATDMRRAWTYFDDMRSYREGIVVFHAAGWGSGVVTAMHVETLEVEVRFHSGRKDRFPLRTAVEIFERLPDHDLRAQQLRDPDAVRARLKKEPLEILRSILLRYGGRANNVTLRNALMQIGVDGNAWSTWWRKTRMLAENSEWFRVTGNATRAEIELLRRALDPVESLRKQLKNAPRLKEALSRVRDILGGAKLEEPTRQAALDEIDRLASEDTQDLEQRLSAWMLLREHRGETPERLKQLLKDAAAKATPSDPSAPPPVWRLLGRIPGAREQERSAALLQEVYGEAWLDQAAQHLHHASPGMVAPLVQALHEAGRKADLGRTYASLLARPQRAPFVLMALARLGEQGELEGDLPTPVQRALALVELGVYLEEKRRGDPLVTRAHQRLSDLLTKGKKPLLRRMLDDMDANAVRSLRTMLQRGVDDRIEAMVTDIAIEKGLDLFRTESKPYWREESIWTTRAGLARRDAELRELRERKIPANAEAIARAASYGDLSENAEWENAIEEQRQLTNAASTIEKELRLAALLENAPIPEGVVAPGNRVRYRETATRTEHEIVLLGPWDTDIPGAVYYRAPLAAGMLGLGVGGKARIELPSGPLDVEILKITPAQIV